MTRVQVATAELKRLSAFCRSAAVEKGVDCAAVACAVSVASIEVLLGQDWRSRVAEISAGLADGLRPARALPGVADVRVCGAVGVIECDRPVDLAVAIPAALDRGVWLRPFRNLVYAMPPYVCPPAEIAQITSAMVEVARLVL